MNTTATCFARLLLLGWLLLLVQRPLSAHPALPTEAGPVSTSAAAADAPVPWSSGQSTLAPAFVQKLVLSQVHRAARQAYLDADARSYGAVVSTAAQTDRDTAAALFDFINSQDRYVQGLQMQDLTVLPVGMKLPTPGGNGSIEMGILRASFFTDRAELSVFVRVVLPAPDLNPL